MSRALPAYSSRVPTTSSADGTDIAYNVAGPKTGQAVLLVHGITEQQHNWDPIVDRLSSTHMTVSLDLRGHGASASADTYDLEAMAGDVAAVAAATGAEAPHLVGHSLGGMVVTALGAVMPVSSIVNVDQSLELSAFKAQVAPLQPMLEDPATFPAVVAELFDALAGPLSHAERDRIETLRRADSSVVLGVWELLFTLDEEAIAAVVDDALAGYASNPPPYLTLFGVDPGDDYADWLRARIPGATVDVWDGLGHYPHLVEPDRFVERLRSFWSA